MIGLRGIRVIEHAGGIAGPYCGKLFADAGADVIKLEPAAGDPLRRRALPGRPGEAEDGGLFRYLNASKRSVVGELVDAPAAGDERLDAVHDLLADADLLIEDRPARALDRGALCLRHPRLVVCSITPFGLRGPKRDDPATDFTLQAEGGSIGSRARPGGEPFRAGGRVSAFAGACFAAVAAQAAVRAARETGRGEHVDFSLHAATALVTNCYLDLMWSLLGRPPVTGTMPTLETPSIEPTRDGFVGFTTYSAQQMSDFLLMIERPDLRETGEFDAIAQRLARLEAWESILHAWTRAHDTDEIIALAQLLRIPVAPIGDGASVLAHEQVVARDVYVDEPAGGARHPRPPYRIDGARPAPPRPAPRLGEHTGRIESAPPRPDPVAPPRRRPLEGLRVVDATTWWAGPIATQTLAMLGADVLHVESVQRMDGSRAVGGTVSGPDTDWWERSFIFHSANAEKRGVTLDLSRPEGRAVFDDLVRGADALVENYSPRVMEGFGITWEHVQALNPRCHYVRMPAFGLDGPWREFVGFAATMEQMAGLSWVTGHVDDQPRIQRGPCDPIAGMHAAFALLVAMAERDVDGRGHFVECAMLEAALNVTAEQVIAYTLDGHRLQREGNRSEDAAPQGLYACRGHDVTADPRWLALSVETGPQWRALVDWLGRPAWAEGVGSDLASRRARHDDIDDALRAAFATRDRDACVAALLAVGVPAAPVVDPRAVSEHPQLLAQGFLEEIEHPVVGTHRLMAAPFRFAGVDRWLERAAPTLGQHDDEVLRELGYDDARIAGLRAEGIIGTLPEGV